MNEMLPVGYGELLEDLKTRIRSTQIRAALAVNRELVLLYWGMGRDILTRQKTAGWGSSTIERLARDLERHFPGVKGLSARNLWRMRALAEAYGEENLPQPVAEIPWGHNTLILEKLKDGGERLWYAQQTLENGWSRNVLAIQIDRDLFHRQGNALTKFRPHSTNPAIRPRPRNAQGPLQVRFPDHRRRSS